MEKKQKSKRYKRYIRKQFKKFLEKIGENSKMKSIDINIPFENINILEKVIRKKIKQKCSPQVY